MPAQPQQEELNINDLLDETKARNKLRIAQTEARRKAKQKTVNPVLGDIPQNAANSEQPSGEQSDEEQNTAQNAEQPESQNQQSDKEEKTKKLGLLQFRKRREAMKELRKFDAELNKLEKLTAKYKSTNFLLLIFLASFVDMSDLLISFFWATVVLIPIGIILIVMKELVCLFIWIKIHKIKTDQKTKDGFFWTLLALAIESIPGVSALPATIARVYKARNSAKAEFEKREDEIKKIQKKMNKIIKQLG